MVKGVAGINTQGVLTNRNRKSVTVTTSSVYFFKSIKYQFDFEYDFLPLEDEADDGDDIGAALRLLKPTLELPVNEVDT